MKRKYNSPELKAVKIDREISLLMMSDTIPGDPESSASEKDYEYEDSGSDVWKSFD